MLSTKAHTSANSRLEDRAGAACEAPRTLPGARRPRSVRYSTKLKICSGKTMAAHAAGWGPAGERRGRPEPRVEAERVQPVQHAICCDQRRERHGEQDTQERTDDAKRR